MNIRLLRFIWAISDFFAIIERSSIIQRLKGDKIDRNWTYSYISDSFLKIRKAGIWDRTNRCFHRLVNDMLCGSLLELWVGSFSDVVSSGCWQKRCLHSKIWSLICLEYLLSSALLELIISLNVFRKVMVVFPKSLVFFELNFQR